MGAVSTIDRNSHSLVRKPGISNHLSTKGSCHSFVDLIEITLRGSRSAREHLHGGKTKGGAVPNRPALARQHQEMTQPAYGFIPDERQDALVPGGSGVKFGSLRFYRSGIAIGGSDDPKGSGHPVDFKVRECVEAFSRTDHGHIDNRSQRDLYNLSESLLFGLVKAVDYSSDGCRVPKGNEEEAPIRKRCDAVN